MEYKILEGDCFGWLKECPRIRFMLVSPTLRLDCLNTPREN
jgi:hypothetical protein